MGPNSPAPDRKVLRNKDCPTSLDRTNRQVFSVAATTYWICKALDVLSVHRTGTQMGSRFCVSSLRREKSGAFKARKRLPEDVRNEYQALYGQRGR